MVRLERCWRTFKVSGQTIQTSQCFVQFFCRPPRRCFRFRLLPRPSRPHRERLVLRVRSRSTTSTGSNLRTGPTCPVMAGRWPMSRTSRSTSCPRPVDHRARSLQQARRPRPRTGQKTAARSTSCQTAPGSSQLWKLPVASFGEAVQVTTVRARHRLAQFLRRRVAPAAPLHRERPRTNRPPRKQRRREEKPEPWVITRLEFKEDAGDGYLTGDRAEHLHALRPRIRKADSAHLRQVQRIGRRLVTGWPVRRFHQQPRG